MHLNLTIGELLRHHKYYVTFVLRPQMDIVVVHLPIAHTFNFCVLT